MSPLLVPVTVLSDRLIVLLGLVRVKPFAVPPGVIPTPVTVKPAGLLPLISEFALAVIFRPLIVLPLPMVTTLPLALLIVGAVLAEKSVMPLTMRLIP